MTGNATLVLAFAAGTLAASAAWAIPADRYERALLCYSAGSLVDEDTAGAKKVLDAAYYDMHREIKEGRRSSESVAADLLASIELGADMGRDAQRRAWADCKRSCSAY